MYKVEFDEEYKGYRIVGIFTTNGYRCGYVGLPKGHPLYGKDYEDTLDIDKAELEDIRLVSV